MSRPLSSKPTELKKSIRLALEWPKICGCGRIYAILYLYRRLPFAYTRTDAFATAEARHCPCGSTLEVAIEIHDLEAE